MVKNLERYSDRFLKKINLSSVDILVDHYTSQKNILSILEGGCFWASHSNFMNDPDDANYFKGAMGNAIFNGLASSAHWEDDEHMLIGNVTSGEDIYFGKIAKFCEEKLNFLFFKDLYNLICDDNEERYKTSDYSIKSGYYVISFSKFIDEGSLMLWRSYANDGKGGKITFSLSDFYKSHEINDQFSKEDIHAYECIYADKSKIKQITTSCIERMISDIEEYCLVNKILSTSIYEKKTSEISKFLNDKLREIEKISCTIKSHHYEAEQEIRLVINSSVVKKEEFWASDKMIIPYIKFQFLPSSVSFVSVGPRSDARSSRSMLGFCYYYLIDKGLKRKNIGVEKSSIRYVGRD